MADGRIKPQAGVVDKRTNTARQGNRRVSVNNPAQTSGKGAPQKPAADDYVPSYERADGGDDVAAAARANKAGKALKASKVIDSYAKGTPSVPQTGNYQLHQGEAVIPAEKVTPQDRARISEDTEREMLGKPQKYGMAMQDEEPAAPAPQEEAGLAPVHPGEMAQEDDGEHNMMAQLQAKNEELESRIAQLEAQLGQKQPVQAEEPEEYGDEFTGGY